MRRHGRVALFLWLWMIAYCFGVGEVRADSCDQFVEDFSGLSPYTWNYDNSGWSVQNERLQVGPLSAGTLAVARVPFYPYGSYAVDVDVSFLSGSDSQAALGIYTLTTGDFFFEIDGRTVDGVAAFYFPNTNEVQLTTWDVTAWDWHDAGVLNVTTPVSSIGFEVSETAITLRVNQQSAELRFNGVFGDVPSVINELWLIAQGSDTSARFDNVCVETLGPASQPGLTVAKTGTGSGTVTSSDGRISCGSDCSESYSDSKSVTLTATPDSGSVFTGWSGGGCAGTGPCTVTVSGSVSVNATFDKAGSVQIVYDGIWKDAGQSMNFYVQTYATGSALVIATADLQTFYTFLDTNFSDGVDASDMGGGSHHLSLSFASSNQASAVLTPQSSSPQIYAISKFFGPATVTTHDGIWKSPSCQTGTMNYYIQSYDTGSGIVIATADLSKLYVFLDSDMSDGVDVADLAGSGAHLTLTLGAGQTDAMVRCFTAPHDAATGTPTASCSLSGTGPSPSPGVIHGPGGSSIELPDETTPGASVTISTADVSEVVETGETSVSQAVKVSVSGTQEPFSGDGFIKVNLPVDGDVTDPAKLTMKSRLTTGLVLPVYGTYDAVSKTYSADVAALHNDWVFGVVIQPHQALHLDTGSVGPAAWQTEYDWKTFSWHVVDHTTEPAKALTDVQVREIQAAAWAAAQTLSNALFRAPKLWISTQYNPHARVIHNEAGKTKFRQPGDEEDVDFSLVSKTEAEMLALGQLYLDYNKIKTIYVPKGVYLKNITIHEMFHAVQGGYDIRMGWDHNTHSLKPYYEGTAGPLGHSYQVNNGSIDGPSAVVREMKDFCEEARLNRAVDDYTKRGECGDFYSKQDFFTYVTRKYNQNDWSFLASLFQEMAMETQNKFGLSMAQYKNLYRKALDRWMSFWTGKSLPEVYFTYALDRAYKNGPDAILRSSDSEFKPNRLAESLFSVSGGDWVHKDKKESQLDPIVPLSTKYVGVLVPDDLLTESDSTLSLSFTIEGAQLSSDQMRIVIFRENEDEVMVTPDGQIEVTDITTPVAVAVNKDVPVLKILFMNGSVENKTAKAKVRISDAQSMIDYQFNFVAPQAAPCFRTPTSDPTPYTVFWQGNGFSGSRAANGLHGFESIQGQAAADLSFISTITLRQHLDGESSQVTLDVTLTDLPRTSSESGASVFYLNGQSLLDHVSSARAICGGGEYETLEADGFLGESYVRIQLAK